MSQESRPVDTTELAERLSDWWQRFKRGQIISYRWMAIILIVIGVLIATWLIWSERRKSISANWLQVAQAESTESWRELAERPESRQSMAGTVARLQYARLLLDQGLQQILAGPAEQRSAAAESVEKARQLFQELYAQTPRTSLFYAECALGLAKAEAALVAVPQKPDQLDQFKGQVPKVIEYLQEFVAVVDGTPWAEDGQKLLEALQKDESEFVTVQRRLFSLAPPTLPSMPDLPLPPGNPPSLPPLPALPGDGR